MCFISYQTFVSCLLFMLIAILTRLEWAEGTPVSSGMLSRGIEYDAGNSGYQSMLHACYKRLVNGQGQSIVINQGKVLAMKGNAPENSILHIRALKKNQVAIQSYDNKYFICMGKSNNGKNKWITQPELDMDRCLLHERKFGPGFVYSYRHEEVDDMGRVSVKHEYLSFNRKGKAVRKEHINKTNGFSRRVVHMEGTLCTVNSKNAELREAGTGIISRLSRSAPLTAHPEV